MKLDKKKKYVAPAIEVIEMKTEGVLAYSGGEKFQNKQGIDLSLPEGSSGGKSIWSSTL